jgi:hypothetical protein
LLNVDISVADLLRYSANGLSSVAFGTGASRDDSSSSASSKTALPTYQDFQKADAPQNDKIKGFLGLTDVKAGLKTLGYREADCSGATPATAAQIRGVIKG